MNYWISKMLLFANSRKLFWAFSLCSLFLLSNCKKEISNKADSASSIQYLSGGLNDKVQTIKRTKDGGFLFCGSTITESSNTQAFMLKTDRDGKKEWYKTYGDANMDNFTSAAPCSDGGFIAVGEATVVGNGSFNVADYAVKVDANGNLEWQKSFSFGTGATCRLLDVIEGDGGIIYATGYFPSVLTWQGTWFLKFNLKGNLIISKPIEGHTYYKPKKFSATYPLGFGLGNDIIIGNGGNIVIATGLDIYSTPEQAVPGLLSLTPTSAVNFYYPYLGIHCNPSLKQKVIYSNDGYYIATNVDTFTTSGVKYFVRLLKTDLDGNIQWTKSYAASGSALMFDFMKSKDGSFFIVGNTSTLLVDYAFPEFFYNAKTLVLKIDANGNEISQSYTGSSENTNSFKCIQEGDNGELFAAGYTNLNSSGFDKMFVSKLNSKFYLFP